MVNLLEVVGTAGGAGATTVTAHLAAARVIQKKEALVFDFCPNNVLRLHFNMLWEDIDGFAPCLLNGNNWHESSYRSAGGVDFVPFGHLQSDAELTQLSSWLFAHKNWFGERLNELQLKTNTQVICDCPINFPTLRNQVTVAAKMTIVVMTPDPLSYSKATQMALDSKSLGRPVVSILLNGFNPTRSLDRDILSLLRANFSENLAPVIIHLDESLREAFACKQTVFEFAPSSQAAYEFHALATWIAARMAQLAVRS